MRTTAGISGTVQSYLDQVVRTVQATPTGELEQVIRVLDEARWAQRAVFTCGNGGSAATAIHFASDLAKGAMAPGKPSIKALSLCENVSLVTAWANDASYEDVFAERLAPWVKAGDVLIAISGSGNSPNVLNAVKLAKAVGATTVGLTGFGGGRLKDLVDICLIVPSACMEQIEDVHLLVCHLITTCLRGLPVPETAALGGAAVAPERAGGGVNRENRQ